MNLKRIMLIVCVILAVVVPLFSMFFRDGLILDMAGIHLDNLLPGNVTVEEKYIRVDKNQNDIDDPLDIVNAAREEVENRTRYKSAYYEDGYPPDSEGVCTDVIWRGLAGAGINLKDLIDQDIMIIHLYIHG